MIPSKLIHGTHVFADVRDEWQLMDGEEKFNAIIQTRVRLDHEGQKRIGYLMEMVNRELREIHARHEVR